MSKQELKQKGFTIIEVVLVLAIAALIFLMVFIALPALQRNQRDAARKDIIGKVASGITTYQSNNRGNQPTKGSDLSGYIDGITVTTAGSTTGEVVNTISSTTNDTLVNNNYVVQVAPYSADGTGNADRNFVQVFTGAKCDPNGVKAVKGSNRNAAVIVKLENGDAFFCQEV